MVLAGHVSVLARCRDAGDDDPPSAVWRTAFAVVVSAAAEEAVPLDSAGGGESTTHRSLPPWFSPVTSPPSLDMDDPAKHIPAVRGLLPVLTIVGLAAAEEPLALDHPRGAEADHPEIDSARGSPRGRPSSRSTRRFRSRRTRPSAVERTDPGYSTLLPADQRLARERAAGTQRREPDVAPAVVQVRDVPVPLEYEWPATISRPRGAPRSRRPRRNPRPRRGAPTRSPAPAPWRRLPDPISRPAARTAARMFRDPHPLFPPTERLVDRAGNKHIGIAQGTRCSEGRSPRRRSERAREKGVRGG